MKIGILTQSLQGGGTERMVSRLANSLCRENYEVVIYLFDKSNMVYELEDSIKVYGKEEKIKGNTISKGLKRVRLIRKTIIDEQLDVLLAFMSIMVPFAVLAAAHTKCKVIGAERANPRVFHRRNKMLINIFSLSCDGYVFQTHGAKSCYPKRVQNKAIVIGNMAPSFDRKVNVGNNNLKICSAGRLHSHKDYETLILAFKKVKSINNNTSLAIYGDGVRRNELMELVKELELKEAITFEGFEVNLMEKMQEYSIFAFSSKSEGMPNVLLEAMAVGLACVATNCNFGPSDLIQNGENGFLVPVGDVDAMAEKMLLLLDNAEMRAKMGANAEKVQEKYSQKAITTLYLNYMKAVCRKSD